MKIAIVVLAGAICLAMLVWPFWRGKYGVHR